MTTLRLLLLGAVVGSLIGYLLGNVAVGILIGMIFNVGFHSVRDRVLAFRKTDDKRDN